MNSLGTTIFIAFLCNPAFGEDAPELCGTCWCVNGDEACPAFGPGIYNEFDPALTEVLASFQPDGSGAESFVLTDEAGEDCFPFASSTEPNDEIPLSDLPPCVAPPSSDDANTVCAMQVTGNDGRDDCCGQTYTLFNYSPDEAAALPSGAYVTHEGHCGVCSTAQDLAVMGSKVAKSGRPLDQQSITCTTLFVIGKIGGEITSEFDKLVKCFEDEIGYSSQCARLWAHGATLTSTQCLSSCAGAGGDYNGPPPECELSQCIKCNEDVQGEMFGKFAGRTSLNSGIVGFAYPCSSFTPYDHAETCSSSGGFPNAGTCSGGGDSESETPAPASSGGGGQPSSATAKYASALPLAILFTLGAMVCV